jgi:hypothetical protein
MLKLTSFSMFKLMVSYSQLFWTPQFNIGHEKILLDMWWTLNYFLLLSHTLENYKTHNILHILKLFTPKCHNPWDYSLSQNCEKIFNFIVNNESITFCMDYDLIIAQIPNPIFYGKSMYWCNYLKVRTKKLVSYIWFHFVGIFNLQVAYGFYVFNPKTYAFVTSWKVHYNMLL